MRNRTTIAGLMGLALAAAGCGLGGGADEEFHAANLRFTNITDNMVHVSCTIDPPGAEDPQIQYVYGVADANGVAQAPFQTLTSVGGFADLTGLQPDTTYTVAFHAFRGGVEAKTTPTLSFHTMKAIEPSAAFLFRTLPGGYNRVADDLGAAEHAWLSLVQIDDPSCASGVGLTGVTGTHPGFDWRCMDFDTMTATRAVGADEARWSVEVCDCNAIAADFGESLRAACTEHAKASPACGSANATAGKVGLSVSGHETFHGVQTSGMLLKIYQER